MIFTDKKHSNVFYVYNRDSGHVAEKNARAYKNDYGLDLFTFRGLIYEGRTGIMLCSDINFQDFKSNFEKPDGIERFNKGIESWLSTTPESPRYTRPDERKQDVFPPDPEKENTVFAKGPDGKKHYYTRFYNENGIELFNSKKQNDEYRRVFVQCEGYMIDIGSNINLDSIKERVAGFENGIKSEVERYFNESMASPERYADMYFAEILGRVDEANAHNAPICEARDREYEQREAEREAKRIADEQEAKTKYAQAIKTAEDKILNKQAVSNADIQGKSLIMQLFREHDITIPLKTQGWIINSLHSIEYDADRERWDYLIYMKCNDSTVFSKYLPLLVSAVQTKQQFEEMNQNADDSPSFDSPVEAENEEGMEY